MPTDGDPISRRTLLIGGGAALALVIAGTTGCGGDDDPVANDTETGSDFGDPDTGVLAIGRAYLELHPDQTVESLLADLPPPEPDALSAATTRLSDDFRSGATTSIDGWVLAESEAKAAAVLSLTCEADRC